MLELIKNFVQDEEGAAAVEYGLLVALIAAMIIAAVTTIGTELKQAFEYVRDKLVAIVYP